MRWIVRPDQAEYMRNRQDQNRSKSVKAEEWAYGYLKQTQKKWTRQAIWGCRIFDFWCAEIGIAVEIDGMTHNKNYDSIRDEYNFYRSGIVVLRVPNFNDQKMVEALEQIKKSDTWQIRKVKMREQFNLRQEDSFSQILKKVGLKKAHGNWNPS